LYAAVYVISLVKESQSRV